MEYMIGRGLQHPIIRSTEQAQWPIANKSWTAVSRTMLNYGPAIDVCILGERGPLRCFLCIDQENPFPFALHATQSWITWPPTPVTRASRPWNRWVSFEWSKPNRCSSVAWKSLMCT